MSVSSSTKKAARFCTEKTQSGVGFPRFPLYFDNATHGYQIRHQIGNVCEGHQRARAKFSGTLSLSIESPPRLCTRASSCTSSFAMTNVLRLSLTLSKVTNQSTQSFHLLHHQDSSARTQSTMPSACYATQAASISPLRTVNPPPRTRPVRPKAC